MGWRLLVLLRPCHSCRALYWRVCLTRPSQVHFAYPSQSLFCTSHSVRNPQGQFETTVFRLADGDSVVPMVTETRVEALKAHEFIVGVAAQILQSQQ